MDIGKMRDKVTIQEQQRTPDGGGGYTEAWADVATVWAEVKPTTASAFLMALQPQQATTHRVTIRYRDDVTKKHRIAFKGRFFEIESSVEAEPGFLQISCIESGV